MTIEDMISTIPALQKASSKSKGMLVDCASLKTYQKGEHLFLDKENVSMLSILIEGIVSFYKLGNQEEKRVIFICQQGEILNEEILDGKPVSMTCECLTDSLILRFDKDKFLEVCQQDFPLTKDILDDMALKIRRLSHQIKNTVNAMRGDKKIAAKLWKLAKDHGYKTAEGTEIGFPVSITFLAELVGSKRETVSRHVKRLKEAGFITVQKKRITIINSEELLKYIHKP